MLQLEEIGEVENTDNLFLLTYPKLSFANSQDYRWWLAGLNQRPCWSLCKTLMQHRNFLPFICRMMPQELALRCITLHPGEFRKQDYRHLSAALKAEEPEAIATEMKKDLRHHKKEPNKYKNPTVRSLIGFLSPPHVEQSALKRKRETKEHEQGKTPAKKMRY